MNVTHQDVIDFLKNINKQYTVVDGKLIIMYGINFDEYPFSTLPPGLVFNSWVDISSTMIESIPDDIVINDSFHIDEITPIKLLPVLNIGNYIDISYTDVVLQDYTYIGDVIYSENSAYEHLDRIIINGYIFSTGVLS